MQHRTNFLMSGLTPAQAEVDKKTKLEALRELQ